MHVLSTETPDVFSRVLRDSMTRYVGRSVAVSFFWRFRLFRAAPAQMLELAFLGSGPKGADDLCFHTYGRFSPPSGQGPPLRISQF